MTIMYQYHIDYLIFALTSKCLSYTIEEQFQIRFACDCREVSRVAEILQALNQQIVHKISHISKQLFAFLGIHIWRSE